MRFLQITLYILPLLFLSCKEDKKLAQNVNTTVKDTVLRIKPLDIKLDKLSSQYKNSKFYSIDRFYKKLWPKDDLSGGLLVAKNGQIIYETYGGFANRSEKTEIESTTPLHIASVSKVLTAAAVLKLIDFNKLELDQKVNTILTEFPY